MARRRSPKAQARNNSKPPRRRSRGNRREQNQSAERAVARVDKNRKGIAYLVFDSYKLEDLMVPRRESAALFHGDRVEVSIHNGEVTELNVLEHRFRELVGRFSPMPGHTKNNRSGFVIYDRRKTVESVRIENVPRDVKKDDWIQVKLTFHKGGPYPVTGEVVKTFGDTIPPSADIDIVAAEFNLIEDHTPKAKAEAKKLTLTEADFKDRKDLRHMNFVTIDGESARDFDDAILVEQNEKFFTLWVAIADVSHYVKAGTALDTEAYSRATSVYFPERAFHMLPSELSEGLCSLRPNEPRLAMVAKLQFKPDGTHSNTQLMNAVIESKRRATYNEIQDEYLKNKENANWDFGPHFNLYRVLRQYRNNRGSIDFEFPEAAIDCQPDGVVKRIYKVERFDSHRLIEEFMIAANEAVSNWMIKRKQPFIYRIHDQPRPEKIESFLAIAANMGFPLKAKAFTPKAISTFIGKFHGHKAEPMLNMALLRSMKQAIYSANNAGHFGLASTAYTHFTSPIRRYPDLIVHRMLKAVMQHGKIVDKELETKCEHCSYRERVATEADREATRVKRVRYMIDHLGDEFEGSISALMERGFFVQLDAPFVEGFVSSESLGDDFYEYIEEKMTLVGRRKNRRFQMGDKVQIRVVRADLDERKIDFLLLEK